MVKPVVLTLLDYYLPGFKAGGPLRTVANTVDQLGHQMSFRIVTRDRDWGDVAPYRQVARGCWQQVGAAEARYLAPEELGTRALTRLLGETEHDVLYLNSAFSPRMTLLPLVLRRLGRIPPTPLVLAPRGEFSPGALKLRYPKKWSFLRFARALGLYRDVIWQASSPLEEQDIRRWFGRGARVVVAPNLGARKRSPLGLRQVKQPGSLSVVFLSRINRMKNLDGAIRLLAGASGRIDFHIYGPCEDREYWAECQGLIQMLPENVHVEYFGPVANEEVPQILRRYDLFFLPTLGENYGHVILEALLAGCPVLISDRTPWNQLEERGAGWGLPLEVPDRFHAALQQCVGMDDHELDGLSKRAVTYGESVLNDEHVLSANVNLFHTATEPRRLAA